MAAGTLVAAVRLVLASCCPHLDVAIECLVDYCGESRRGLVGYDVHSVEIAVAGYRDRETQRETGRDRGGLEAQNNKGLTPSPA